MAITLALPGLSSGQERRSPPPGPPPYDASAETTITAKAGPTFTMSVGQQFMILTVTSEGRVMHVILGPPDFVKKQPFTFKEGASVEVTGVPGYKVNSEPAMMARRLKAGTQTLTLRDAAGKPAWEK
jgi:hypothetical protein